MGAVLCLLAAWGCSSPTPTPLESLSVAPTGGARAQDDGGAAPSETTPSLSTDSGTTPPGASDGGANDAPSGPPSSSRCDTREGLDVYCVQRGGVHATAGTIEYGPGFPADLPALGLGAPNLGYVPVSYPFTCIAKGGQRSIRDHNVADGKICEAIYDNSVTTDVSGTASYEVSVAADAPDGDYRFGLHSNYGSRWIEPDFFLRVGASPAGDAGAPGPEAGPPR